MRNSTRSLRLFSSLVIFLAWPVSAQVFGGSTDVVVVEVPVHVVRDGQPVRGLTRDDFEVFDERKSQEIIAFDVVDLGAAGPSPAAVAAPEEGLTTTSLTEIPVAARRHFLLLFDLSFSQPSSVAKARAAAGELIENGLHPTDLVAVATYTAGQGPSLVLGFTSDRGQAELAIDTLGLPQLIVPQRDPLQLLLGDLEGIDRQGLGSGDALGFDREFVDTMRELGLRQEKMNRQLSENRILALTGSFTDLAKLMSSVRGRKHVVYLSEGFDTSLLFGTRDQAAQQQMNRASELGRVWEIDSEQRYGSTRGQSHLRDMLEEFRRADCVVQSVDIGGLRSATDVQFGSSRQKDGVQARLPAQQDGLFIMAESTGGELYQNFNNLSDAMGKMLDRTSVTYVLGFQPKKIKLDGKYHNLKVRLKDAPSGTRLVHRPGYYAPKPFAETSAEERRLSTAELILGNTTGGAIDTAVLATAFRGTGEDAVVPILLEIGGKSLSAVTKKKALYGQIYAYALDSEGRIRDYLTHPFGFDVQAGRQALEENGLKFYGSLELGPGDYELRVLVRNDTGHYGLSSIPLRVPRYGSEEPVLLPPLFVEPPDRWLLISAETEEGGDTAPYPFVVGGQSFIPAIGPVLAPGETVAVNLMAYHFGFGQLQAKGRIVGSDGRELAEAAISGLERAASGVVGLAHLKAAFETGALASGDYRLEVTVRDPSSGRQATSSAAFSVGKGG